ncbi:hypothetical protein BRAO375_4680022 [Bradyrhizobium sp. ORS 375]|uniref:AAA family ATPase n=1 Tax=Bradyrhizobium sp. (strain ORS 375) TaxID=566679 RepID=UPI0002408078|nr:ATP-binding protein [Bradyrhizobium sp. ORS 375]CCD95765.1 hypothetical protein BRAO375_4680022 [Bradyrhizobium sp. ORS 375]
MTLLGEPGSQQTLHAVSSHVHDVTQVAGDLYQLFLASPPALRDRMRIREFGVLIAERLRAFVGREFAFDAIRRLVGGADFPSGYILVRGEPGVGKTALMCALVRKNGYLHHFNIAPQNIRSSRAFHENICAQLIVRYRLSFAEVPASAVDDSAFLSQLLEEAAAVADGPIVIVLDALDEAEDPPGGANQLFLPPTLPNGVYFVVSSREQADFRLAVDRREDVYLRDDDPANLADISLYISTFVDSHADRMRERLAGWGVTRARFIDELTERSQGNFMYLVHVLNDIRDGRLGPETIEHIHNLPRGLQAYYRRHWAGMRSMEPERFERVFEPVLRLLATVREPVTVDYLEDLTSLAPSRIREVIDRWRPFLNEVDIGDERRFRVYHLSFQEFLAVEGMGLKPFHRRIALRAIEGLPGLLPPERPD